MTQRSGKAVWTGGLIGAASLCLLCGILYVGLPVVFSTTYESGSAAISASATKTALVKKEVPPKQIHLATPEPLKAIYMSSWVAATPSIREKLVKLIDDTEINAIVIDIKDATGMIAFAVEDPELQKVGSADRRIRDLREFLKLLHEKNIYVIGRVATFQDPYFVKLHPELAVKRASDGGVWKDRKGLSWIDPGSEEAWKYILAIAKESYAAGFDEINFDYIRFPSDGNMKDIAYPWSGTRVKSDVLAGFFAYLSRELKPSGMVISADLFGMTTTAADDLGIGQVLEKALPNFDYIAPMIYPSHYPPGFNGYKNPAAVPYETISYALEGAVAKVAAASTTPHFRKGTVSPNQIRPWLQDFDLGADYTAAMVRAQITATYDAGLTSWMLWDPSNKYTREALD
jgi:hypothetical protein